MTFLLQTRHIEPMETETGFSNQDSLPTQTKFSESINTGNSFNILDSKYPNKADEISNAKSGSKSDSKQEHIDVTMSSSWVDNIEMMQTDVIGTKTEIVYYTESLMKEFWDSTEMKFVHPRTGQHLNIQESINCGVISPELIQVKQANGKTMSLQKAINSGQVNVQTGQTLDLFDGKNITFREALEADLMTISDNKPVERCDMYTELGPGLVALIAKGEIDKETKIVDTKLKHRLSIPESIDQFLFDTEHGKVKDNESGKWLSWDKAKNVGIIYNPSAQQETSLPEIDVKDIKKKHISFSGVDDQMSRSVTEQSKSKILEWKKGVIEKPNTLPTQSEFGHGPVMLDEAIKQGLYSPVSNTFKNPVDGSKHSFEDALIKGLINKESLLRDPVSRDILSLAEAVEKRVIDPESGKMLDSSGQPIPLNYAYNLGLIMRSQSPLRLSISEVLDEGLYDEEAGTFLDPDRNMEITFTESIATGLLDPELIRVKNTDTGEILRLETAVEEDLISVETGIYFDKTRGKQIQISDALERGLIIDTTNQPKMSLQSALEENMVDVDTCLFFDPVDGSKQTLKAAIESCLLDKDSVLVRDPKTLTILTLESAISEDIVHPQTGKYNMGAEEITFSDAFEKGLVVCNATHGAIPCSLIEAIRFNLYDPVSKKFIDPRSGQTSSLEEAINTGLLDTDKTMIKDTQTGRFLSLSNAAYLGIINLKTADVLDIKDDVFLELTEAKEKGILRRSASDECISLVTAVGKGNIGNDGKVYDRLSGKDLVLSDAILTKVIDSAPTLVKDTSRNTFVPILEAIESGIIDENHGHVLDVVGTKILTFPEAIESGLIVEIPSTGLTLAEAINDGLFDEENGMLLDLRTGKKVTLEESLEQKLIDSSKPQVVVPGQGLLSLKDAFEMGVMDCKTGNYIEDGNEITLTEAVDRDLIVKLGRLRPRKSISDSDLRNIEALLQNKDVIIKDPMNRSFIGFESAVGKGVVDLHTQTYCDLKHNIILPLNEAAKEGLVINARHPDVGLANLVKLEMFDNTNCAIADPRSGNKVTLEEGVKQGLIDPFQTRVKNIETGTFISLQQALKQGIISGKTGTVFDKTQKKSFPLDFAVRENLIIDFNKSSFTVDEGIRYGLMTHDGLMVEDLESGEFITFKDAVGRGTVKIQNAVLECPAEGVYMTLAEGIEDQTVDEKSAMVKLPSGRRLSLSQAVAQNMIVEKDSPTISETHMETDEMSENEHSGESPHREGVRKRTLELDFLGTDKKLKRNGKSPILSPISDMTQSCFISSWIDTATYERSDSVSSPIRFDEALKFGFLDVENGEFKDNITNEIMPIEHAIETGKLSIKGVHFYDEKSHFSIPLKEAMKTKLVVSKHGTDAAKSPGVTFKEALDQSLLILQTRKTDFADDLSSVKSETFSESVARPKVLDWLSSDTKQLSSSLDSLIQNVQKDQSGFRVATLFEAIQKDLVDENEGTIYDSFTQKALTLKNALSTGLINPEAEEIFNPLTNTKITLENAINTGIIDPQHGKFKDPSTGEVLTLKQACEKGFIRKLTDIVESKSSVEIYVEEILANDMNNGKNKLQEAFASGVLTKSKTQVIDPDTVQPITLRRAGSLGMLDGKTGEFKNPQTGEHISLVEAVQKGFILSPKGLSLYSAVNQGLYSDLTGKFTDPNSGKECTLSEMLEGDVIADACIEIRDVTQTGELIRLKDAVRKGVIDPMDGKYVNVNDGKKCTFNQAIALGLIISNIPREGLRESSSSVAAVSGHQGNTNWALQPENDVVKVGPDLNVKEKEKLHTTNKEAVSLSSIETESSGYETNKSQSLNIQEAQNFVIDFEKYKLKQAYSVDKTHEALEPIDKTHEALVPDLNKQKTGLPSIVDMMKPKKLLHEDESHAKAGVQKHVEFRDGAPTGRINKEGLVPSLEFDDQNISGKRQTLIQTDEMIPKGTVFKDKLSSKLNDVSVENDEIDIPKSDSQTQLKDSNAAPASAIAKQSKLSNLATDEMKNEQTDTLSVDTQDKPILGEMTPTEISRKDKVYPSLSADTVVKQVNIDQTPVAPDLVQRSQDLTKSVKIDKTDRISSDTQDKPIIGEMTQTAISGKDKVYPSLSADTVVKPINFDQAPAVPNTGVDNLGQGSQDLAMSVVIKNEQTDTISTDIQDKTILGEMTPTAISRKDKVLPKLSADTVVKPDSLDQATAAPKTGIIDLIQRSQDLAKSDVMKIKKTDTISSDTQYEPIVGKMTPTTISSKDKVFQSLRADIVVKPDSFTPTATKIDEDNYSQKTLDLTKLEISENEKTNTSSIDTQYKPFIGEMTPAAISRKDKVLPSLSADTVVKTDSFDQAPAAPKSDVYDLGQQSQNLAKSDLSKNEQTDTISSDTQSKPIIGERTPTAISRKDKVLPSLSAGTVVKPCSFDQTSAAPKSDVDELGQQSPDLVKSMITDRKMKLSFTEKDKLWQDLSLSASMNEQLDPTNKLITSSGYATGLDQGSPDLAKSMLSNRSMILSFTMSEFSECEPSPSTEMGKGSGSPRTPKSPIRLQGNYGLPGQGQGVSQRVMLSPVKNKVFTFQTGPPVSLSEERKVFGFLYKHLSELGILSFD